MSKMIAKKTTSSNTSNNITITTDDVFKVADLFFKSNNYKYRHLYNSYEKFIDDTIPRFLTNSDHVFTEIVTDTACIRHKFEFKNIRIEPPKLSNGVEPMFPTEARHLSLSYNLIVYADVSQIKEVLTFNLPEGENSTKTIIGKTEVSKPVMIIPVMVRSKYCNTNQFPEETKNECRYDPGGYFIVKGSEKVVICQDRIVYNTPMVSTKKVSNIVYHIVEVKSKPIDSFGIVQQMLIKIKKDNIMIIKMSFLHEINVIAIFKALGIISDKELINICTYDINDTQLVELVRTSVDNCYNEATGEKIVSYTQALDYLISKIKVIKKYNESNIKIRMEEKKMHLNSLLQKSFLPHIKGSLKQKAYFLGYTVNKLLKVFIGRKDLDNRDSYCMKRVDNINELFEEIMKAQYTNIMTECDKKFTIKLNDTTNSDDLFNIIHEFKPSTFDQGFKSSLMLGNWPKKKGVSQMLQRYSHLLTILHFSRVDSQSGSQSASKLTKPRQQDISAIPFLCPVSTPEGAKIGLIKHLSMISSLTIGDIGNTEIVREYIITHPDVIVLYNVNIFQLKKYTKIFLNGEWLGVIDNQIGDNNKSKMIEFYEVARQKKLNCIFNNEMTSITFDNKNNEVRFHTDSGRLYRPVFKVKQNEIVLDKKMVDIISLDNLDKDKITSWEEYHIHKNTPIEFIDAEEQPFVMIAETRDKLELERQKMVNSLSFKMKNNVITNRYNENTFCHYDYVEIHPSLLLSDIATNIPFCSKNQAPRNIFQYAQGKQGMNIYITTYRTRTDISYILYNPEVPVVNSRTSKYSYTDVLPPGSNAVVAIACYGGFNQEDSLVFNATSLKRGLYMSTSLKKYASTITKNNETSNDEKFMKPPPDKTIGIKAGVYDKMNENGYVPEETVLTNGDMIFGKVTPINDPKNPDKKFRDSSEPYKAIIDGVVDRIFVGIKNEEGYETRKALIRSERIPHIGDKFCSRHGQKGTMGIGMDAIDLPFNKYGVRPDIIMNPNAVPSRMTIGQLWECIFGKVGALIGTNVDGTSFETFDMNSIKDKLEKLGYNREGQEYLYNGMTGEKIQHDIFIGPTFYQRLKHMVQDKIHARAEGASSVLTRQAPEGRSRDGGLRLGEMERDAIIAHGMALFLKERFFDCADKFRVHVCGDCGLFAVREKSRIKISKPTESDTYICPSCESDSSIVQCNVPYSTKLLMQELTTCVIIPRIVV
uniref:DNA-directed RNA polymerase n=1 Tax=viral metagenome TaxID=1070528 RepID=A0A6C0DYG6_9ZZZZ